MTHTCRLHLLLLVLASVSATAAPSLNSPVSAPLAYDPSTYEIAPQFQQTGSWSKSELLYEITQRIAREKQRTEIDIYYYRIGYTWSFPLALDRRPLLNDFPSPIRSKYPWLIWYAWDLEERWRLLHFAWKTQNDHTAGAILQKELAALSTWDRFAEVNESVGLVTGHLAAALALALADPAGWDPALLTQSRQAAQSLIERDVWPWFKSHWAPKKELTPRDLANIPVIALVRSAQLARVISNPHCEALDECSLKVLRAWCRFRLSDQHHTEGTAYDGYLLDSVTEWLAHLPDAGALQTEAHDAFRDLALHFVYLSLPGRPDLHAPLGDVEPEMTFWATVLARLTPWYQWTDSAWLLQRFQPDRMRAPALLATYKLFSTFDQMRTAPPPKHPKQLPNALALRTGWDAHDLLAAIGFSRGEMGHLHADAGQIVLGWYGRFWIMDPGYQQYRPGDERDYTLGVLAHNTPVIGGVQQSIRAPSLIALETTAAGYQYARIDLTSCYPKLPAGASVQREVWLLNAATPGLVARDTFKGFPADLSATNSWHAGTHFAWAFVDGWARLSDGSRALWIGTSPDPLQPGSLTMHPGSRGPLSLVHNFVLPAGDSERWWFFCCDRRAGWKPPIVRSTESALEILPPGGDQKALTFERTR